MEEIELKKGIAQMYYAMSRACRRHCEAIEEDYERFYPSDMKLGYELYDKGKVKYQLVLELKKVE